ncbi:MAG: ATP-binding cassette domain-containing protein [Candidatus Hydrogenedentes bacterium]|nr:ATP-binding cassette domain-containing protein [Candidatus Hydrogenedentota bacterium]
MIDFACGKGDLLLHLAKRLPSLEVGVGIDIAPSAIEACEKRTRQLEGTHKIGTKLNWIAAGLEGLSGLLSSSKVPSFDLLLCRDAYYLLSADEQCTFWKTAFSLLGDGGAVFIADLSVRRGMEGTAEALLVRRQHGGQPIIWNHESGKHRSFSHISLARKVGFELNGDVKIDEFAVGDSYREAASQFRGDEKTVEVYSKLATFAAYDEVAQCSSVPYIQSIFVKTAPNAVLEDREHIGIELEREINGALRPGSVLLPWKSWSLIIGRSGAGKTTLLNLLAGTAKCRGVCRVNLSDKKIYLLPQDVELLSQLTVGQNIELFSNAMSDLARVCTILGLDAKLLRRKADSRLSGGERQRVAIAQALVAGPDILLLDEPSRGIDRVRREQLLYYLGEYRKSGNNPSTVIWVDHDFWSMRESFDTIYEIMGGRVVCLDAKAT